MIDPETTFDSGPTVYRATNLAFRREEETLNPSPYPSPLGRGDWFSLG